MVATPEIDKDRAALSEKFAELSKARKKFHEETKKARERNETPAPDDSSESIERRDLTLTSASHPPAESIVGRGRPNALAVDAPARTRPPTSSPLPQFHRRLARLSTRVKRTDQGSAVVFDFGLFEVSAEAREFGELSMRATRALFGESTGGGSFDSCVIVSTERDHPAVEEFVIRLDSPAPQYQHTPDGRNAAVKAVTRLVETIGPPTSNTRVWIRTTPEEMDLPRFTFHKGYSEINGSTYPHVGGRNASVHPMVFLDFLADLIDAYPEQLD